MSRYIVFGFIVFSFYGIISLLNTKEKAIAMDIQNPVVLELFTSQSCSSCPPADNVLERLSQNENVIALGYHVTYWNHLSWKDTLSHEFSTNRQHSYAASSNSNRVYTPEMRINGIDSIVGSKEQTIIKAMNRYSGSVIPVKIYKQSGNTFSVALPDTNSKERMIVNLVSYGKVHTQAIARGENRGRTVDYTNPVNAIRSIASDWDGQAHVVDISDADFPVGTEGFAVIVQKDIYAGTGPIIAAGQYKFVQ